MASVEEKPGEFVVGARSVSKRFGHVQALTDASLEVSRGEVVALFGDNGAGKSTLMNVLCGVYPPDHGTVTVAGRNVGFASIRDAHRSGIDAVHQHLSLAPHLTVLENMFLGHERLCPGWRGWLRLLDRSAMGRVTQDALRRLSIDVRSVRVPIADLSGGQRQAVAVARAVMWSDTAVLMDEPTAALGPRQSTVVCDVIRATADRGLAVLVVSHDIPRLLEVADRVAVMRQGQVVRDVPNHNVSLADVVGAMVGQEAEPT